MLTRGAIFSFFLTLAMAPAISAKLREADPRLNELWQLEMQTLTAAPRQFLLYFQQLHGNFAVFYDYVGTAIYLRYRFDRWDFKANAAVANLHEGWCYRVDFQIEGFSYEKPDGTEDPPLMTLKIQQAQNQPAFTIIRPKTKIFIGGFLKAKNALPEFLRH